MFQQQEAIVVLVLDTWSIVEDTDIRVNHLIITNEKECWDINWLFCVGSWDVGLCRYRMEGLLDLVNDLLVTDIASGNDNHVLSIIVG